MTNIKKLAIVGFGPRGLYAAENLISKLDFKTYDGQIELLLFEKTGNFGYGQVYDINQVETNWINISERILFLNKRPETQIGEIQISGFPSYHEWANKDFNSIPKNIPDSYPPRAKIGKYLKQRFETFIYPLLQHKIAFLLEEKVIDLTFLENQKIRLNTNSNSYESIDEVLLTIGHQPTKTSKQLMEWENYFVGNKNVTLFKNPYPIEDYLNSNSLHVQRTIGIRGFGLAMIDVVRGIASKFGNFKVTDKITQQCDYFPLQKSSTMFVPFSLDGLPPVPKPLNAQIDNLYQPTEQQLDTFKCSIGDRATQKQAKDFHFLIEAIAPIVAKVYSHLPHTLNKKELSLQHIEQITLSWLKDNTYQHPLIATQKQPTQLMMQNFVAMATATTAISLDFCIGQVWRHCQPTIYEQLSHNECNEDVFAEIIHLDEAMKMYAYGPPVESIQQMLALESAGVMTFQFANNPKIELSIKGWVLKANNKIITVDMMINSVLDAPQIKSVNSLLVKNLLSNDLIKVVHDDFGVLTNENGYLICNTNGDKIPIALLGRLAKGTIIGVDAILECFGNRPLDWAEQSAKF